MQQLPDLDLELYYENEYLNENPDTELLIKDGEFNWGKMLTKKEKEMLHSNRRQINKGKGKRMPSSPLRGSGEPSGEINDEPSIFNLSDINLNVEKVCMNINICRNVLINSHFRANL